MVIESARATDEAAIKRILESADLPIADLTPALLDHFFVLRDGAVPVGVIGLELNGTVALLRSLAVDSTRRGRGDGAALVVAAESYAARQGVRQLYLLTATADGYFAPLGYCSIDRGQAPDAIRRTSQFQTLCPASSTLMVKQF